MRNHLWLLLVLLVESLAPCTSSFAQPTNELRPWNEYRTIMWVGDSAYKQPDKIPLFFQRLRDMGINTAMAYGDGDLKPLLDNKFPYYVENMVNKGLCLKWNSKVQDWDKFVTAWVKDGRPESALIRDYCLDDPDWRNWAANQMQQLIRKNREHEPLAYDIRDELSTTISANPFDYDFHPLALAQFRQWLQTRYTTLDALNAGWETKFASWDEVKPFTTDQIKNRMASGDALPRGKPDWQSVQRIHFVPEEAHRNPTRWNFSPWADFRTYMDLSLARALDSLRQTSHKLDPRTPVGIEGTQMPDAFGGYDLWRLSQALDWMEPYDIGNAREILGSFMPGKTLVTTVFENDTRHAQRRLWHLLLEGDRGCIVWWSEDCFDWKSPDYNLTPKAQALAPVLKEMNSPLAQIFLRAKREHDPIYFHYSQPSIQLDWLLESTVDGSTWLRRFSSFEADHNQMAKSRDGWLKAFQDLGYSPVFVSSEQLERGFLARATNGVLVLANSTALSDKEIAEALPLNGRASGRGRIFYQNTTGLFDEHCKLRASSPFPVTLDSARVSTPAATGSTTYCRGPGNVDTGPGDEGAPYLTARLKGASKFPDWLALKLADLKPEVEVPASAHTRVHRFRAGPDRLLAVERNISYQMSEDLKQAGGNEPLEKPVDLTARLQRPFHIYDLRAQKYLGRSDRIQFTLAPWQPSLFALLEEKVPVESLYSRLSASR